MLNKKEVALMKVIYKKTTNNNGMCLVRPVDIMEGIPYNLEFDKDELEPMLTGLAYDEYFELVETDKKGEYYFCITLLKKGFAFQRTQEMLQRTNRNKWVMKFLFILVGAIGSLLFSLLFKLLKWK